MNLNTILLGGVICLLNILELVRLKLLLVCMILNSVIS